MWLAVSFRRSRVPSATLAWLAAWCLLSLGAASARADGNYPSGYVWDPLTDWTPGSIAGSTSGNPGGDSFGMPVWSYEHIVGVPGGSLLGSTIPWYERPTGMMVWDTSWYGQAGGAWVYADDTLPNAKGYGHTNTTTGAPVIRWTNPSSEALLVNMVLNGGTAHTRFFSGSGALDLAIVLDRMNGLELLYGATYSPASLVPTGDGTAYWLPEIDLGPINVQPGESIFVTSLNRGTDPYCGGAMYGHITVVPEPATLGLALGLSGILLLRRRS